jgi:hypothetical protein
LSKKTEEIDLENPIALGSDPAASVAAAAVVNKKHSDTKKSKRLTKRAARKETPFSANARGMARTTKSKKTSKAQARTRAVDNCQLVKPKETRKESKFADKVVTNEDISAAVEVSRKVWPSSTSDTACPSEMLPPTTFGVEAIGGPAQETAASPELDETGQSTSARRKTSVHWLAGVWNWVCKQLRTSQTRKRLRVCESVSLGEKRFVAVIEVDGEQFLVGGASSSVATLARLEPARQFAEVLKRRWSQDPVQA